MSRQQREKEDTELKLPETISPCTQSHESRPSIRLMEAPDPTGSDLVFVTRKALKRKRGNELNRCSCIGCNKKLGLMGFRCRCGEMFCPEHRYSDRHSCSFDYKAAGREAIARENPVVRAAKLVKV